MHGDPMDDGALEGDCILPTNGNADARRATYLGSEGRRRDDVQILRLQAAGQRDQREADFRIRIISVIE